MASPLAGGWKQYGSDNADLLLEGLTLPAHIKCAIKQVRVSEELHVNGEYVHLNVHVPTYSVPANSSQINFTFGKEHHAVMPWGSHGKATVQKVSDSKWLANITHSEGFTCTATREIRNGEMWVTFEGKDHKLVSKFERCDNKKECGDQKGSCSPFQGSWRLYGHDGFECFAEAAGVPQLWRYLLPQASVYETIHVNGDDVHVKVCLSEIIVPSHCVQSSFKFNEPSEHTLYNGQRVTATVQKISDTKWHSKLTCKTLSDGEASITRQICNDETFVTIQARGKQAVFKFSRCAGSCK